MEVTTSRKSTLTTQELSWWPPSKSRGHDHLEDVSGAMRMNEDGVFAHFARFSRHSMVSPWIPVCLPWKGHLLRSTHIWWHLGSRQGEGSFFLLWSLGQAPHMDSQYGKTQWLGTLTLQVVSWGKMEAQRTRR